ncbi:MAG: cyclic nucleotide-binding domain-containing protein [Ignavibacteria bacterium]|nr:cyclic nucleotide-binding domain-containing protein [Ignavibacteria bacterium]
MVESDKKVHSNFWANIFNPPTESDDLLQSLRGIPLFKLLAKKDLVNLMSIIHKRNYLAEEIIFYQGDPGIGLYIIREGEVMISRESDEGDKITLAVFKKGDFFGELALIDNDKRSASAIAKSDTKLSVIFKPDLDEFIEKYPKKGIKILEGIAEITAMRLRTLNEDYFNLRKEQIKGE